MSEEVRTRIMMHSGDNQKTKHDNVQVGRLQLFLTIALIGLLIASLFTSANIGLADTLSANGREASIAPAGEDRLPADLFSPEVSPFEGKVSIAYDTDIIKGQETRFICDVDGRTDSMVFKFDSLLYRAAPNEWDDAVELVVPDENAVYTSDNSFSLKFYSPGEYRIYFWVKDGPDEAKFQFQFTIDERDSFVSAENKVEQIRIQCEEACAENGDASDFAKALWLNDWIINNTEYDGSIMYDGAEVVFDQGIGSSKNYHDAYAMLLKAFNIETVRIDDSQGNVWTGVKLDDGNWYNVDTSLVDRLEIDASATDINLNHLCFGLPNSIMGLVHTAWDGTYVSPESNARMPFDADSYDRNYYIHSRDIEMYTKPYLEDTSGAYSIKAQIGAGKMSFSLPLANGDLPAVCRDIVYALVAHDLSNIDWGEAVGRLPVAYKHDALYFEKPVEPINEALVLNIGDVTYNGKAQTFSNLVVKLNGATLKADTDYTVVYKNNLNAGTATVVIAGKGSYGGTISKNYMIKPASLSQASVVGIVDKDYTGSYITQNITVSVGGHALTASDYDVSYANNKNPGTATLAITGKGNYTGSLKKTFAIKVTTSNNGSGSGSSGSSNGVSNGLSPAGDVSKGAAQVPEKAPSVTGAWKKASGKWWFQYDAKSQKALKSTKNYPANGWIAIKGKHYHFDSKGYMSTKWYKQSGSWYYLGADGAMKTGWQKVSGKWYYLNPSDGKMKTGFFDVGKSRYYSNGSGVMQTGWKKISNKWYHFKGSGAMSKGWTKASGRWYYLNPADGIMKTGWLDDANKRYYLNGSGKMLAGWQKIANKWHYFNKSGVMQKGKWVGNYWVGSDGVMAKSTWVDGGKYYVDGNGKWDRTR